MGTPKESKITTCLNNSRTPPHSNRLTISNIAIRIS
jgi:hypothetical protein